MASRTAASPGESEWRRGWDSNPRTGCPVNGFRDRPIQPLWHLSGSIYIDGGESGIRTHGRVSPTHAFQACSLSHSDISPELCKEQFPRKKRGRSEPLPERREEAAQKRGAVFFKDPGRHFQPVVEARVLDKVAQRPAPACLGIGRPPDQP